jgi:cell division protein FtsA
MGQFIAALDLGTSKSIAFVAQKDFRGRLSDLHSETLPSKQAIRRGRVYNLDETSEIISKLIQKLNEKLSSPIEKIYVGIGGQSLRTQLFNVNKVVESGTINQQLLESLKEEALNYKPEFDDNLGIFSCEYYADGQLVVNPKGTVASVIEARFQLIVGNPCLKRNLETVLSKKDISVAGYFISPLATAEAVLTPAEKKSGCALIEWGEGITYVSVYKDETLKYLVTLPLGGLTITKDIRSLNVSEEEAETLKIKHGSAVLELTGDGTALVNEGQDSSRKIGLKDLNWIIEARVDEIMKNVWSQIQASGYSQTLNAGIVITGGGALLRDLPLFIRNLTGKEVRLANARTWDNQVETQLSPADSCVAGLVTLGKDNCLKAKVNIDPSRTIFPPKSQTAPTSTPRPTLTPSSRPAPAPRPSGGGKIGRGIRKIFAMGEDLFKDEDFIDNIPNKPIDKDSPDIQHKDKD